MPNTPSESEKLSNRKKALANSVFAGLTSLADGFFLLLLIFAGRMLETEQFGAFNTALAVATVLIFVSNLGLDSLAIRRIAIEKDKAAQLMGSVLLWKMGLVLFICGAYLLLIRFTLTTQYFDVILIMCLAAIFRSLNITTRSFLQAHERFDMESLIVFAERMAIFLSGVTVLWLGYGIMALAWAFIATRLLSFLTYLMVIKRVVGKIQWRMSFRQAWDFQKEALPLGVAVIIYGLYTQADVLMLSYFHNETVVGIFSSAYKILEGFLVAPIILCNVMYPRLSVYHVQDKTKHYDYTQRTLKYLAQISLLLFITGALFAEPIMSLLYGVKYTMAAPILAVMLMVSLFAYNNIGMNTVFRSIGKQSYIMKIMFMGLATKIGLNLLLIPTYGYYGATAALGFSLLTMTLLSVLHLRMEGFALLPIGKNLFKVALAAVLAMAVSFPFAQHLWALLLLGFSFILFNFVFKSFDRYEIELLVNLPLVRRLFIKTP